MLLSRPGRLLPLLAGLLLAAPASLLRAQSVGGSVGPAVPVGALGEERGVGIRIQGSLYSPNGLLRADVAGVHFPGSGDSDGPAHLTGDYRSLSAAANLLPTLVRFEQIRMRGLIGISGHRVSIPDARNPYGIVAGAQLGGILERGWSGRTLAVEGGLHLIASDHGLGELEAALFIPVTIGIRW